MQKVIPVTSLLVIVGLTIAVAVEARNIFELTQRLKMAESRAEAAEQRAKKEESLALETKEQGAIFQAESEALRKQISGGGAAAPPAGAAKEDAGASWSKAVGKMFTDPEMKKMMRKQQSMAARMMYADLIKQLGLSQADSDRLMELLADRQMEMAGKSMAMMSGTDGSAQAQAAAGKAVSAAKDAFDAQLKDMLGGDGYNQFQQYEKTLGDRMMMQQYQQQFTASGQTLQDSQRDALLQIMIDERLNSPPSPFDSGNSDPAAQMQALQSDQALHDFMASQADFDRRVLEKAGQVLTPEQLTAFQTIQQQMTEMQQAGIKIGRTMFQKK